MLVHNSFYKNHANVQILKFMYHSDCRIQRLLHSTPFIALIIVVATIAASMLLLLIVVFARKTKK